MAMQRSTILAGPAIIQMSSQSIYTSDAVKVVTTFERRQVESAIYGKLGQRVTDIKTEITFTPDGMWTSGLLAVLFPWTNPTNGTSMFTAADVPVTVWGVDGLKQAYAAGAVTKMPDIILSAGKPTFGSMTITCIGKDNTAWSDAAKRVTTSSATFNDATFSLASIKSSTFTAAFTGGSSPWDSFKSKDGFTFSSNVNTQPVMTDDEGLVDLRIAGVEWSCKFAPVGITVAQIHTRMGIQGAGAARGMSPTAADLVITGAASGDPLVTLKNAVMVAAPQHYGYDDLRHGEVECVSTRPTGSTALVTITSVGT